MAHPGPIPAQVFDDLGRRIVIRLFRPHTFFQRLRGLIGREPPSHGEGWWFERCGAVHTFGLRYPIDVLHLSASGTILAIRHRLAPGRISCFQGTFQILELGTGRAQALSLSVGGRLEIRP